MRKHIGTLRIRVSPNGARATLDHAPLTLVPGGFTDVRAVIGPAELHVDADGFAPVDRHLLIERDEPLSVDLNLVPTGALAGGPNEAARPGGAGPLRHTTLGWGLVGGAVAGVIIGAVGGIEAINFAHDFNTAGAPGYQAASTRSEGIAWRTSADVFFTTAIALGAAGTYFLVVPLPKGGDVRALVGPASVGVSARF